MADHARPAPARRAALLGPLYHHGEHDRVFDHQPGIELFEGVARRRPGDFPVK